MNGLVEYFRESIPAKVEALLEARRSIDDEPAAGLERVRRLAHSLRGSAGSFGFPQISAAAGLVESAEPDRLDDSLEALVSTLRTAIASDGAAVASVLVVAEQADEARAALQPVAHEIVHVETGSAAVELLERDGGFGLAIVDLVLPDMDGRSLLIKLRESRRTATLPVFVTSALGSDRLKAECLALGAQQFIEKPVNPEVLAAAVTATLQLAGSAAERWSTDPLTGLRNRAAFGETFRRAAAYASRNGRPLSVGIIDLDCFKTVNDTHGHGVGDAVLQGAAQALLDGLRESDAVARWGGEEFVVLFPDTPERGGVAALDKVREQLGLHEFPTPSGRALRVSFSGGVSELRSRESLGETLARADGHLYRAKAAGRNRIFCADDADALPARTVLLVEDDDSTAALIEHTLAATNTNVLRCRTGEEALERLGDANVSLGILDVNMPGMDGFTLLERMQQNPATAAIPVLMLTGRGSKADVVRGLSHGAADYVVKPFSPPELSLRVCRLLKQGA